MAFDKDAFLTALDSMTVMELNDLVLAAALLLLWLKKRPSSTWFCWMRVHRKCPSSRPFAKSLAWASKKPRIWLMAHRRTSKKALPRLTLMLL